MYIRNKGFRVGEKLGKALCAEGFIAFCIAIIAGDSGIELMLPWILGIIILMVVQIITVKVVLKHKRKQLRACRHRAVQRGNRERFERLSNQLDALNELEAGVASWIDIF